MNYWRHHSESIEVVKTLTDRDKDATEKPYGRWTMLLEILHTESQQHNVPFSKGHHQPTVYFVKEASYYENQQQNVPEAKVITPTALQCGATPLYKAAMAAHTLRRMTSSSDDLSSSSAARFCPSQGDNGNRSLFMTCFNSPHTVSGSKQSVRSSFCFFSNKSRYLRGTEFNHGQKLQSDQTGYKGIVGRLSTAKWKV